jgi:Retinoblastoma-associated protein B domain/Retinoblastoma-associated protein A domain
MERLNSQRSILKKLCEENSVNEDVEQIAFFHFTSFIHRASENNSLNELEALLKFSILVCSRLASIKDLNFSSLFSYEFLNWENYISLFNKFLVMTPLPSRVIDEISQLIQSVQISKTVFCKLVALWKTLEIKGNIEYLNQVMQGSWLLFICCRSFLLTKTNSIVDCLYLMLGVMTLVIQKLPKYLSCSVNCLKTIADFFKSTESEALFWKEKVLEYFKQISAQFGIEGESENFRKLFSRKRIKINLEGLYKCYGESVKPNSFDERTLSFDTENADSFSYVSAVPRRNINGKILKYETDHSDCNDIIQQNVFPTTPLTMAMEMIKWVTDIILESYESNQDFDSKHILAESTGELQETFDKMILKRELRNEDAHILLKISHKLIEVKIYFLFQTIHKKLTQEKSNELSFEYDQHEFAVCLFVYCVELVFYAKNIIHISFSEILDTFSCSGFGFSRFIPLFTSIKSIPGHFKQHLLQIETKILMHIGWKEDSSIHKAIREVINNSNAEPIEDNFNRYKGIFPEEYEIFFDKMITESGCRVDVLCKSLKIEESVKEKIWNTVKYAFSEKTEMIFGRHIAVIIICSIYAITKIHNPVRFKDLIEEYWNIFEEEEGIFSLLKLRDGKLVEIIEFYNQEYVPTMKAFIDNRIHISKPRVPVLSPNSSLAVQIDGASPKKKSPFSTPRTKYLLASPSTYPKLALFKPKPLSFENLEPPKIPRFLEVMLFEKNEQIIPMPVIKKPQDN